MKNGRVLADPPLQPSVAQLEAGPSPIFWQVVVQETTLFPRVGMAARPSDEEWFKRKDKREPGVKNGSSLAVSRRTVQPTPARHPVAAENDTPKVFLQFLLKTPLSKKTPSFRGNDGDDLTVTSSAGFLAATHVGPQHHVRLRRTSARGHGEPGEGLLSRRGPALPLRRTGRWPGRRDT